MENEKWEWIPDYEGYYQVSTWARVRSVDRYADDKNGKTYFYQGQMLKLRRDKRNYLRVSLSKNGIIKGKFVHNLMLRAFVGLPPSDKHVGCHRDDDVFNNDLSNLYWGTQKENSADQMRNGNMWQLNKTHCVRGHPLEGENLRLDLKPGERGCLACHRVKNKSQYSDEEVQALTDLRYEEILLKGSNYARLRSHCEYGHPLEMPNLPKPNNITCYACQKARGYFSQSPEKWANYSFQEVSDIAYDRIIKKAMKKSMLNCV